jgi:hypothetical protein
VARTQDKLFVSNCDWVAAMFHKRSVSAVSSFVTKFFKYSSTRKAALPFVTKSDMIAGCTDDSIRVTVS